MNCCITVRNLRRYGLPIRFRTVIKTLAWIGHINMVPLLQHFYEWSSNRFPTLQFVLFGPTIEATTMVYLKVINTLIQNLDTKTLKKIVLISSLKMYELKMILFYFEWFIYDFLCRNIEMCCSWLNQPIESITELTKHTLLIKSYLRLCRFNHINQLITYKTWKKFSSKMIFFVSVTFC